MHTMQNKLNNKFLLARKFLNLSQMQIAEKCGLTQRDISQIENGKRVFIPTNLINFYYEEGIDINSIYNLNEEVRLRNESLSDTPKMTA